jgi:hypothetical protein
MSRILCKALLFIVLLAALTPVAAQDAAVCTIRTRFIDIRLRAAPTTEAEIVGILRPNTDFLVTDRVFENLGERTRVWYRLVTADVASGADQVWVGGRVEASACDTLAAITTTTATTGAARPLIGTTAGSIPFGGSQAWSYEGRAGEVVTVTVLADWDPTVELLSPAGALLAFNDDIDLGLSNLNSQIVVTLPADGIYQIIVRSFADAGGGGYSMIVSSSLP